MGAANLTPAADGRWLGYAAILLHVWCRKMAHGLWLETPTHDPWVGVPNRYFSGVKSLRNSQ